MGNIAIDPLYMTQKQYYSHALLSTKLFGTYLVFIELVNK